MLDYAVSRSAIAPRQSSPQAMLAIISVHVAVVAAVMSAKMDLPQRIFHPPIEVDLIPDQAPPPEHPAKASAKPQPSQSTLDQPPRQIEIPTTGGEIVDSTPSLPTFDDLIGRNPDPQPRVEPKPQPAPVKTVARLITPASDLKPPYPASKLASGEEAVLTLRLSVDERGRVVAVEPVGRADRTFLEAARRHMIARWRYQPATEDGRATASAFTVTLRFQLDE